MQRLFDLPIREEYKQTLAEFCSSDKNAAQCQQLCDASDEEILATIDELERTMADWTKNGAPEELNQMAAQIDPNLPGVFEQSFSSPQAQELADMKMTEEAIMGQPPQGMPPSMMSEVPDPMDTPVAPQGYARGGLATLGRFGDNELVHAQKGEMVIPRAILNQPGARQGIRSLFDDIDVNPNRYVVGSRYGSINPDTGRQEFFLAVLAPILGGMVGQAAIGGALGAGIGTFLGSYLATGDMETALFSGLTGGIMAGVTGGFGSENTGLLGSIFGNSGAAEAAGAMSMPVEVGNAAAAGQISSFGDPGAGLTLPQGFAEGTSAITSPYNIAQPVISAGDMANAATLTNFPSGNAIADPLTATGQAAQAGSFSDSFNFNNLPAVATDSFKGSGAGTPPKGSTGDSLLGGLGDWWNGLGGGQQLGVLGGVATLLAGWKEAKDYNDKNELDDDPWAFYREWQKQPEPGRRIVAGIGGRGPHTGGNTRAADTWHNPDWTDLPNRPPIISPSGYSDPYRDWNSLSKPVRFEDGGLARDGSNSSRDTIPAMLRDGEFVLTPEAVRGAGDGSIALGAKRLNQLMSSLESRRG